MSKYYVYTYAYPESMGGAVFYVGKGTDKRIDAHEKEAKSDFQGMRHKIIRSIWGAGEQPVKRIVFETDDEPLAYRRERELIALYSKTLANIQYNTGVNPIIRTKPFPPPVVDRYTVAIERGLWLNRQLALRYPEHEREQLLAKWDESTRRLVARNVAR